MKRRANHSRPETSKVRARYPGERRGEVRYRQPGNGAPDSDSAPQDNGYRTRSLVRRDKRSRLRSLRDLDGRTRAAKLAKVLITELERDAGGQPSAAQRELIQRAALLGAIIEDAEARWLEGNRTDLGLLGMLAERQRRILESLGLHRVMKDITPAADAMTRASQILDSAHVRI